MSDRTNQPENATPEPKGSEQGLAPRSGPAAATAHSMIANGVRDPGAFASLIAANPAARNEIVALLHRTYGNSFVTEVMSAAGSQGSAAAPAPSAPASPPASGPAPSPAPSPAPTPGPTQAPAPTPQEPAPAPSRPSAPAQSPASNPTPSNSPWPTWDIEPAPSVTASSIPGSVAGIRAGSCAVLGAVTGRS